MSTQTDLCLGCGNTFLGAYCPQCEADAINLIQSSHWPLEASLSTKALSAVETGVRIMLDGAPWGDTDEGVQVQDELHNLAATIRAHLQHVEARMRDERKAARAKNPTPPEKDPLLL